MTVEHGMELGLRLTKNSIVNESGMLLTHVQWFISPWAAGGDPDNEQYWALGEGGKGGMAVLHTGTFRFVRGSEFTPGDYRVELNAAWPDGSSKSVVQHLVVNS